MAFTMVNDPWEIEGCCDNKPTQGQIPIMTFVNLEDHGASTIALSGIGHRFARTAKIAATVLQPLTFKMPLCIHRSIEAGATVYRIAKEA